MTLENLVVLSEKNVLSMVLDPEILKLSVFLTYFTMLNFLNYCNIFEDMIFI